MSDLLYMLALLCLLAAPFFAVKAIRKQMPWKNAALALGGFFVLGLLGASTNSSSTAVEEGCLPVPEEFSNLLIEDLPGATLTNVYAVQSPDHGNVYYVAGQFTNPAVFGEEANIGVWATNKLDGRGLTFAVNSFARMGSNWGDGTKTSAELSSADDGAMKAQRCSNKSAGR